MEGLRSLNVTLAGIVANRVGSEDDDGYYGYGLVPLDSALGVAADRLRTVSYGKERPLDPTDTERAYSVNRRAHFSVSR